MDPANLTQSRNTQHPDENMPMTSQQRTIHVGIVATSFPLQPGDISGIFVERLVSNLPENVKAIVLTPAANFKPHPSGHQNYQLNTFSYAPSRWQRIAHQPGGIPDALRRRDPAVLLLPLFVAAMILGCVKLARKVDILHGNWTVPALVCGLIAKLSRKTSIATIRGDDFTRAHSSWLFKKTLKWTLQLNFACVTVSQSMADKIKSEFPDYANRVHFIPNGVSIEPQTRRIRRPTDPIHLITVGSLIRRKRVDTILTAIANLDPALPIKFRSIGDGPELQNLCSLADELKITSQVEFLGKASPEDIHKHLAWADTFILASESEGRSNALIEAMAAGLSIIASDIDGSRELLGEDSGLQFGAGNSSELADNILRLAKDPGLAVILSRNALQRCTMKVGSWRDTGAKYAELYCRAAGGKK